MPERIRPSQVRQQDDGDLSYRDYDERLRFSPNHMGEALEEQGDLFNRVGRKANMARSRADAAEQRVKQIKAELDAEFRRKLTEKQEKYTETSLLNMIMLDDRFKDAFNEELELRRVFRDWDTLKWAYEQRSEALKIEAGLYQSGYFGDQVRGSAQRTFRNARAEEIEREAGDKREARQRG